ncbi:MULTISPECIES: bifunctional hydroxymethylpyrimidine kinase/phosphomethylpyrimidine kinase [unclassified Enterococcus]|uniref:bifunctional hydroxymethylpyrimidine kinase/phosphomethylpyrimidine kinase n=1 Tax=unclassified Enterococcus TaxID=2608891 RepID=UPI0015573049|nr:MULTISPECIES: bifunctional hydroxymethylpyrimidine kinase/phosphomethylpyrimidine kinase [unclassified Enterococcus]MBS7576571.1 bifunctional hydroxymethylpyrimidine kinase/phosphomethylpyrimidine kinase [Enterococcus sp. MMGLQ5-2]MBS7583942.1 bifunctional hydroxymethylpyrimidine kinase/phosphomethylpyrimidine kinase [Enterococcus sp. MMGLQ5-1]NPD11803.1 bifunctional hydroxymethylpyrimidine kinase/phosphomethylpyrimidine kinase [Enterococcus sp. MMGLQ5-1]NPD36408.1 bifunctional hydroxymethyl
MEINQTPQALTIAGSDSGGGAGIQADLKTFQARQVFGMSIITALTAQNTYGVKGVYEIPPRFITEQFEALAADFELGACKTGMLATAEIVQAVVENYQRVNFGPLVVDPVMVAKGGSRLLSPSAIDAVKNDLLPIAELVTPNIPEAEALVGYSINTEKAIIQAAYDLKRLGANQVIIKGGHSQDSLASDFVLFADGSEMWYQTPRIDTLRTHGTGDTFASCIVAELAKGTPVKMAVKIAKAFIYAAISQAISVGHDHGPTNHWAAIDLEIVEMSKACLHDSR